MAVCSTNWKQNLIENDWVKCFDYETISGMKVAVVPQGVSFYHGGGAIKANVMYPIGREFYDPSRKMSAEDRRILTDLNVSENVKRALVNTLSGAVDLTFLGSYETARTYSGTVPGCGVNCVAAYKTKREIRLLDLFDASNAYILLTDPDILTQDEKNFLAEAYGVELTGDIMRYFITRDGGLIWRKEVRKSLRNDASLVPNHPYNSAYGTYFVPKKLLSSFPQFDGLLNPRTNGRFSEIILRNSRSVLKRDFSNSKDWQNVTREMIFGEIGKVINDMKRYNTSNIDFHAGNLYAHSVWVALCVQYFFDTNSKWVTGIPEFLRPTIVIGAFLHDIGKAGDNVVFYYSKPDHPKIGKEYSTGERPFLLGDGITAVNIDKLMENIGQTDPGQLCIIRGIIRLHWDFGALLRDIRASPSEESALVGAYVANIGQALAELGCVLNNVQEFHLYVNMIILVSACDVKGSQAYVDNAKMEDQQFVTYVNAYLKDFNYIVNYPKSRRGGNKFEDFGFDTFGFDIRNKVLNFIEINAETIQISGINNGIFLPQ